MPNSQPDPQPTPQPEPTPAFRDAYDQLWRLPEGGVSPLAQRVAHQPDSELTRQAVAGKLGLPIPEWVWACRPWGRRLLVMQDHPDRKIGSIHVPDAHQEPPGAGWVLKAGGLVGTPDAGLSFVAPMPWFEVVGCRVIFSRWSGFPLMAHTKTDELLGSYLVMPEGDILGFMDKVDPPNLVG